MAGKRRARSDSLTAAVAVAQRAQQPVVAPSSVPLDDAAKGFFANIVDEVPGTEWTGHQIELAAFLAREMASLEREQVRMADEQSVLATEKGTPVVNPRKSVIQMHASTILSLRRSLSLHARAKGGEARDLAKRRGAAKRIEDAMASDDPFLN